MVPGLRREASGAWDYPLSRGEKVERLLRLYQQEVDRGREPSEADSGSAADPGSQSGPTVPRIDIAVPGSPEASQLLSPLAHGDGLAQTPLGFGAGEASRWAPPLPGAAPPKRQLAILREQRRLQEALLPPPPQRLPRCLGCDAPARASAPLLASPRSPRPRPGRAAAAPVFCLRLWEADTGELCAPRRPPESARSVGGKVDCERRAASAGGLVERPRAPVEHSSDSAIARSAAPKPGTARGAGMAPASGPGHGGPRCGLRFLGGTCGAPSGGRAAHPSRHSTGSLPGRVGPEQRAPARRSAVVSACPSVQPRRLSSGARAVARGLAATRSAGSLTATPRAAPPCARAPLPRGRVAAQAAR